MAVSTIGTDRPTAADLPTPTAEQPAVVIHTPAASPQTPEPTAAPVRFSLSASERDTVERVVMAESGGESFDLLFGYKGSVFRRINYRRLSEVKDERL